MDSRTASIYPLCFGRRQPRPMDFVAERSGGLGNDLKLFATTFAAGFLFVSLYLL
jgi:hypothetical protein